ncbi:MAG: hypothetical protein GWN77_01265, partial [Gammaproteobacteria bacterium]|nr:hypothetical protein [Gammaproteobacteria bacterium]
GHSNVNLLHVVPVLIKIIFIARQDPSFRSGCHAVQQMAQFFMADIALTFVLQYLKIIPKAGEDIERSQAQKQGR